VWGDSAEHGSSGAKNAPELTLAFLFAEFLCRILGKKQNEVAELLQSSTDPKHAHGNKALAKAERISARTCVRVAASIRNRLNEERTAIKVGRTPGKLQIIEKSGDALVRIHAFIL
jgi:hypothetical protein